MLQARPAKQDPVYLEVLAPPSTPPSLGAHPPSLLTVTGSSSCCSVSLKLAMRKPRQALQRRRSRAAALWGSTAPATKLPARQGWVGLRLPPPALPQPGHPRPGPAQMVNWAPWP